VKLVFTELARQDLVIPYLPREVRWRGYFMRFYAAFPRVAVACQGPVKVAFLFAPKGLGSVAWGENPRKVKE
jgi:hypothetical protein